MKGKLAPVPDALTRFLLICAIALVAWPLLQTAALGAPPRQEPLPEGHADYVPGEILFKPRAKPLALDDIARSLDIPEWTVSEAVPALGVFKMAVPPGQELAQAHALQLRSEVEYAEPNYIAYAQETPDDTYFHLQWGLTKINVPQAWDLEGHHTVTIAVVDTGVDGLHEDLYPRVTAGYDFVSAKTLKAHADSDDNSHGTHVAGIVAAATDNGRGIAGIGRQAVILPVKVLDASGEGTYANVANGIRYAAEHGADIINLSLGGPASSQVLEDAVNYASALGCLLVAASGNYGSDSLLYPANYPNVMSVGATDSNDRRYSMSNYGPLLDIVAPGVSIFSTLWGQSYGYKTGTSMACAYASGVAAHVLSICPSKTAEDVRALLGDYAVDLGAAGWDPYHGHGRIDALAAVQHLTEIVTSAESLTFIADQASGPLPDAIDLSLGTQCAGTETMTWTATITPTTATWLSIAPSVGTLSQQEPATLRLRAAKDNLDPDREYHAAIQVVVQSERSRLDDVIGVTLKYQRELNNYYLVPLTKHYSP